MMMMEDTRRQVAMGDMVHDMLIDRPPSPARMEYRLGRRLHCCKHISVHIHHTLKHLQVG